MQNPDLKFWIILVGQLTGFLLIWFISYFLSTDPSSPYSSQISSIKQAMENALLLVFIVTCVGVILYCWHFKRKPDAVEKRLFWLAIGFAFIDLIGLELAVISQGGLSHTVLIPLFFLVPTFVILLRLPNVGNACPILLIAFVALLVVTAFVISHWEFQEVIGLQINPLSTVAKSEFNVALLIASLYSLLIPIAEALYLGLSESKST